MKRAIVIGATSGIGRALAERLAAQGYRVGVTGRREALLEELAATNPGSFCYAAADIADPAASRAALERLASSLGGLDLCVVSAGTGDLNPGLDYALEEPTLRTNVVGWTAAVDWAYGLFERQAAAIWSSSRRSGAYAAAVRLRPTTLRKPIRSTMPRGCASGPRSRACLFR